MDERATSFAFGLRSLLSSSSEKKKRVAVYAETRLEWMLSAAACFKSGVALVTLYTNLGEEDVAFGISQTG